MPSGYQPLSQSANEEADVGDSSYDAPSPGRPIRELQGLSRPGAIDLSKLDTAFKRWTESIAQKVKRKKKVQDHSRKEILRSVFEPSYVVSNPTSAGLIKTLDHKPPMTKDDFATLVQSVRNAISAGIQPKMITKGSSGSYFARCKVEGKVQTVGVFKPKDEEPYGRLNPKTTKWLHRQLRWIIPFGRACLIPNLSYISEAAASLLDERLQLNIVPRTELVSFSSPAFYYDWIDRNQAKKGKILPDKIGSMQYFLHGFQDSSDFLRKHPWPGRAIADTFDDTNHRKGSLAKKFLNAMQVICGTTGHEEDLLDDGDDDDDEQSVLYDQSGSPTSRPFYWTKQLQRSFREELEKLVILDYLMLNTDRGADNYMIKYCDADHEKTLVDIAPTKSSHLEMPLMSELRRTEPPTGSLGMSASNASVSSILHSGTETPTSNYTRQPHIHIAAIDNSLSFPHEHPKGWRSYAYGWLYLPVSVIGRPFSEKTRNHFLPLLTSKTWWEETTFELRKLFAVDPDFHPKMFARQLAVIKGQAWNIVESLKHADEGPLELTRRTKQLVWDDEVESAEPDDDDAEQTAPHSAEPASPKASINTMPLPRRVRSHSTNGEGFPPPMRRTSTDARPVPFSAKFQSVHQSVTGVTVLEHLERLDAVERSLKRLGGGADSPIPEEDEEVDVGESQTKPLLIPAARDDAEISASPEGTPSQFAPHSLNLSIVQENLHMENSVTEEDVVMMSKSLSHVDGQSSSGHVRWGSMFTRHQDTRRPRNLDWMQTPDDRPIRTGIVERLEPVEIKPLLACC
ncbi:hypothetical protein FIBSPDRAFT_9716 [Athelia psychrophila]|uniref:Phosphatidylinositol 4-kinase n=1 Tax=Athelia psychrophila TaxID=1759441 RepID=A0A166X718_9AGAM|nr:hypothetical protein FIBSPDRAFT_9716 [Fibularhizoctonia sp. CBS 109695]